MDLKTLTSTFKYRADPHGRDQWSIMPEDYLIGDCEDFALSVLYYVVCNGSIFKFWWKLIIGDAKLCYVEATNGGHAVLKVGDKYIDNWTLKWVSKSHMEGLGHRFVTGYFRWWHVAKKLL